MTIFERAIETYGKDMQLTVAVEEQYAGAVDRVLGQEYGIADEEIQLINEKQKAGGQLTKEEQKKLNTFYSEVGATMSEQLLGNERVIRKLVSEGDPLVDRVISWAENVKKTLSGKGEKFTLAEKRRMDKALKLYLKAAEAAGNRDLVKRILALREEDEENNSAENEHLGTLSAKNHQKESLTNINQENMHVSDGEIRYSFKNSQNGLANDGLTEYSGELRDLIEERGDIIVDSYEKLVEVVNLAFDEPSTKKTIYFGIIEAATIEKIKNSIPNLPKELEGKLFKDGKQYSVAATLDSIRHLVDEKSLTREDVIDYLDRFADTVTDFDSVTFNYYDGGNGETRGLLFRKKYIDGTYLSFDLISNKKRSLILQSLYMDKADYIKKKSAKTLLLQNATASTPKVRAGQTSNNSITDSKEKVNSETKYSRKTDQERSTLTKGEAQKQKANYESDKVYTKAEISKMVESLSGLSSIPKRFRTEIVNDIWTAFNSRYSPGQREMHASFLADKIFARVMQESGDAFDNTSQEDLYAMEREIHKALKRIAKDGGSPSTRSKLEAEFNTSEAGYWKKQRDEALERIKITGKLMDSASKMRSLKVGDFLKASNFKSDDLKGTVEQLARINFRGNLNVSGTRGLVKKLAEWYTKDNPLLKGQQKGDNDSVTFGQYDEYIAYLLNNIANGTTGFSNAELTDLNTVITYFNKFVESYAAFPNGQGIQQGSVGIQYNYGKT